MLALRVFLLAALCYQSAQCCTSVLSAGDYTDCANSYLSCMLLGDVDGVEAMDPWSLKSDGVKTTDDVTFSISGAVMTGASDCYYSSLVLDDDFIATAELVCPQLVTSGDLEIHGTLFDSEVDGAGAATMTLNDVVFTFTVKVQEYCKSGVTYMNNKRDTLSASWTAGSAEYSIDTDFISDDEDASTALLENMNANDETFNDMMADVLCGRMINNMLKPWWNTASSTLTAAYLSCSE